MMIPNQIRYQSIKPVGWHSKFKEWQVQPMSSNTYWNPQQIVRFLLTLTNGFMDPYRSHIFMKVAIDQKALVGALQVDNSAQSFISQLVVSSNNTQIQRITQYDTLAAYLTDIGLSQVFTQNRQWQGIGHTMYQKGIPNINVNNTHQYRSYNVGGNSANPSTDPNPNKWGAPSIQLITTGKSYMPTKTASSNMNITVLPQSATVGLSGPHCSQPGVVSSISQIASPANFIYHQSDLGAVQRKFQDCLDIRGFGTVLRAQYNPDLLLNDYIDSTNSYLSDNPLGVLNLGGPDFTNFRNNGGPYQVTFPGMKRALRGYQNGNTVADNQYHDQMLPNLAGLWGFNKAVSSKFSVGTCQPVLSNWVFQCQFAYGKTLGKPVAVPVRQFSYPLISGICGILIPQDQFCLLPLKALNNLLIELTLSSYAMFTSGYQDYHQLDQQGIQRQQLRGYKFSELYYNLHIYQFPSQQIARYLQTSLDKTISITGSSWALSGQYQVGTGAQIRGTWQINVGAQWLAQVVVLFLSHQYMKYSFCRKQFRLSNNMRSMQLKFNTDFYPSQPIIGNAGCPVMVDMSGDNSQFMQYLLMAYNYKFVTQIPQPRINPFNFAVNSRCYDTTNTGTYTNRKMLNGINNGAQMDAGSFNIDTAMGMPFFHQNRCVGRAAFLYSFQAHGHSRQFMIGADSRQARPFQITFDVWPVNTFPTDQTMYTFTRANVVINYSHAGVSVFGR